MKKKVDNNEPDINSTEYQISLAKALNYFNEVWDKESYKNATIEYALSIGIELPKGIPDVEYRNIGGICRLLTRNQYVDLLHYNYVIKRLNELKIHKKEVKEESIKVPEIKKEVNIKFLEELEDYIDTYIFKGTIDIKKIIARYNTYSYGSVEAKKVEAVINKNIKSFTTHYNVWDDDIKDSYSPRTKTDIKKLVDILTEFKGTVVKLTGTKTVRTKKAKPASIQVKSIPFKKEHGEIKGKHPKELIGKSFAVVYDTETRDLVILHSLASKFEAAGMSYTNLDVVKCVKKKLRKPDEQLKELLNKKNKKEIFEYFESIKTTEQKATGRMSEDKIIIGVY